MFDKLVARTAAVTTPVVPPSMEANPA